MERTKCVFRSKLFPIGIALLILCGVSPSTTLPPSALPSGFLYLSIPEDISIAKELVNLHPHSDNNNEIILYTILNNVKDTFFISPKGVLILSRPLDREVTPTYEITVVARKGVHPFTSARTILTIEVEDVPDNYPVFTAQDVSVSLAENVTINDHVATVQATSLDSFPLFYTIEGGRGEDNFAINSTTGNIVLMQPLNYNKQTAHLIIVRATNGPLSSETKITVNVQDVQLSPSFTKPSYHYIVQSNTTMSDQVLGYVYANDGDVQCGIPLQNTGLIFSTNNSQFQVNSTNGAVSFVSTPVSVTDYVMVSDQSTASSLTDIAVINITVMEYINQPLLLLNISEVVLEQNTPVGSKIALIDNSDNEELPFILYGDCDLFSIDTSSGYIETIATPLTMGIFTIVVGLQDAAIATVTLTVRVTEGNSAPQFDKNEYKIFIQENPPINSIVYQFTAVDLEDDSLSYSSDNLPSSLILASNGELRVREEIDRETDNQFDFIVMVTDGYNQVQVEVTLVIMDINDNSPVFDKESYLMIVNEDIPLGTVIANVKAIDNDEGANGAVTHSIVGSDQDTFYIAVLPDGKVLLRYPLDYERVRMLTVVIQATDNGIPQRQSVSVSLVIHIFNVPDRIPVFIEPSYSLVFNYPISREIPLLMVQALAEDNNTDIAYTITDTNLFTIDELTGQLSSVDDIMSIEEGVVSYQFSVTAMNGDVGATVPVVINVTNDIIASTVAPKSFFVAELLVFLPDKLFLGEIFVANDLSHSVLSFEPTKHQSEDYFLLEDNRLIMLPTVTSRIHKLNISISNDQQTWFDEIEVHVALLTNSSLDHHVTFLLPNFDAINFNSRLLDNLLQSVSTSLSCSVNQLQLVSVQGTNRGTELVLLVLQPDLISCIPKEDYLYQLIKDINKLSEDISWTVSVNLCADDTCDNFQQCVTTLSLFSPRNTITTSSLSITSLPFAIQSSCVCPRGFSMSDNCAREFNECDSNPCQFNGICHDLVNGYECECPAYTSGTNCSIVCPSLSCELCSPNPCQNGGICSVNALGNRACSSCPSGFTGPLCELRTSGFHGDGYIEVPLSVVKTSVSVVFSFATISPNGLLMYIGQFFGSSYLSVEMISGDVRVEMKFGGVSSHTIISSTTGLLSNGQWHTVTISVDRDVLAVAVTDCSNSTNVILQHQDTSCYSEILMNSTISESLPLNTPVYFAGFPSSLVPSTTPPFSHYTGCLRDVFVDRTLIDFSSVEKEGVITNGCPEVGEGTCQEECNDCARDLWNGVMCNQEQDVVSLTGTGFVTLVPENMFVIEKFHIQFRTLQRKFVLSQLNNNTTINIMDGSVSLSHTSQSTFTLLADAFVSDGNWHSITLTIMPTVVQLSVDNGRIVVSADQTISTISSTEIIIGGFVNETGGVVRSGLDGCLQELVLNNDTFSLVSSTALTKVGVADGCSGDDMCSSSSSICPNSSSCNNVWREFTCSCNGDMRPIDNKCEDLCLYGFCSELGTGKCKTQSAAPGYGCICTADYRGVHCDLPKLGQCPNGLYRPHDACIPCACDVDGVDDDNVCGLFSGECNCKENTFLLEGDIGCKPCDCDPIGSLSAKCNSTAGQCQCKEGIGGRKCDTCLPAYAGLTGNGCQKASVVEGLFAIVDFIQLTDQSEYSITLLDLLSDMLLDELNRFGLHSELEISLLPSNEMSNVTMVTYSLSSFISRTTGVLSPLSPHTMAAVTQTIVQNGRLGQYLLVADSHIVTGDCSADPCASMTNCTAMAAGVGVACSDCPEGTLLDGVICRKIISDSCVGIDSDFDRIPDSCDNCPYYFNPDQYDDCSVVSTPDKVCLSDVADGILWAITETGLTDSRMCPSSLIGTATRECNERGQWEEPDLIQCLTRVGTELQSIVSLLTSTLPNSRDNLISILTYSQILVEFNSSPTVGDLNTALTLIETVTELDVILPLNGDVLASVTFILNNLLSENNTILLLAANESSASNLLRIIEHVGQLSAGSTEEEIRIQKDYFDMRVVRDQPFTGVVHEIDSINSVRVPNDVTGGIDGESSLGMSLVFLPSIVYALPLPWQPNITHGAPVWSIQLVKDGVPVTQLDSPINITFPHIIPLDHVDSSNVLCVTWDYQQLQWIDDGCIPIIVTANQTTCSCTHLSSFTLLLNSSLQAPPSPLPIKSLSTGVHITALYIIACIIISIAAVLFIISCKGCNNYSFLEVWLQLLVGVVLSVLFFSFSSYVIDINIGCIVVGLLMLYLPLVVFSWFVIGGIAVIADIKNHWNNVMKCIMSGMAWALPLLYTGICAFIVGITSSSFTETLGAPRYCWINASYVFLLFPVPILSVTAIILLIAALILLRKLEATLSDKEIARKQREFSISLLVITILFLVVWAIMISVVYSTQLDTALHTTLQYLSVITVYVLAITILIMALLRLGPLKFFKTNLHMSTSIELEKRRNAQHNSSVASYTAIFRRRNSSLPSLPPDEEPEYHTITVGPIQQDHYRTHLIQVNSEEIVNHQPLDTVSENDVEVEKILYQQEDEQMESNAVYGVAIPSFELHVPNTSVVVDNNIEEEEFQDTAIEEDSKWFDQTACSPLHQPFSPSSFTTITPLPNRTVTMEEEIEIERLYQLTRSVNPVHNVASNPAYNHNVASNLSNGSCGDHYAEIRPITGQPPSYSTSHHSTPWYDAPDSVIDYPNPNTVLQGVTNSLFDEEVTNRPLPSPPSSPAPPIPPRLAESPSDDGNLQLYAEIPTPETQWNNERQFSAVNRCVSLSTMNVHPQHSSIPPTRRTSVQVSTATLTHPTNYPVASLDRRHVSRTTSNHSDRSPGHNVIMLSNGSQTFQSLV